MATPVAVPVRRAIPAYWPSTPSPPYLLTGLIERPDRLIYLTNDMYHGGGDSLDDRDWTARHWNGTQAYCDSNSSPVARALAIARHWLKVISHRRRPGSVPMRVGGPSATGGLGKGHLTLP
ncbi:hypothetical protein ACH3VR_22795 [Microbacterium sp. B2969]|uniref:Uncharacterized protein n=1 Tax=Microbacterium alkaliflavum TaxID=3248839 RepID=A0ABW7QE80_9MICO